MLGAIRGGQHRAHGKRGRDGGDAEMADEPALQGIDVLAHGTGIGDDAAGPIEYALAFGRKAAKAGAALHQQNSEHVLEILDAGRQRRLADVAGFCRAPEMLRACQGNHEFEFVDHCFRRMSPASAALSSARGGDRRGLPARERTRCTSAGSRTVRQAEARLAAAISTSSALVVRPSDRRTAPSVASRATVEARTCGHARKTWRPEAPGNRTVSVLGSRALGSPSSTSPGIMRESCPSKSTDKSANRVCSWASLCAEMRDAAPRATIDATFSVPGRRPRS